MNQETIKRVLGVILLFGVIGWAFYLHLPTFNDGYLNAGDDHIPAGAGSMAPGHQFFCSAPPVFIRSPVSSIP